MGEFNFTIKYDSGAKEFDGLDHYYGAQSLFGISQILLIGFHAFFNKDILTQAPSAKGFRLVLGKSKTGSWEQAIQLVITDQTVMQVANDLGKNALYDLLKWVLLTGVGGRYALKYRKSIKRARELERENDDLQEKLDEALRRAHSPVKHQGLNVHVMSGRTTLVTFNESTLNYLETELISDETQIVDCAISRFNARTGTGRLIKSLDAVSVPFMPIDRLPPTQNTALADNLGQVARGIFAPTKLLVSEVTDSAGYIKRYRLHRVIRN
ncbi:hypothetical protein D5400_14150 [Georhizobium profundi]|uniref:DUF7946 domain-containing protein n=1 Tax=Georhizobium profundi TaxID=2341112 RepID=A0A3Q8XRW7_9HYPH|nr:hypothetical protein [Georhizobium profundi]AZN72266.1 hypothetical protein D5400_14150 [Georhizobium profundi]